MMNDSAKENEKFQQALAKAAAESLDKSVDDIDDLTAYRIKQIRQKVLVTQTPNHRRILTNKNWLLAACVVASVALPAGWMLNSHFANNAQADWEENALTSQEIPLDPQDFDDMDMLIAMEDSDA